MGFHRFIESIRSDAPIVLRGEGKWRRDFTFIDDTVDGILAAADRAEAGSILNLGYGSPVALDEAVRLLGELAGHPAKVRLGPSGGGEPSSTWSDGRAAAAQIGFRPRIALAEGLRRQWRWQTGLGDGGPS